MAKSYAVNKESIYRWRERNVDKNRAVNRKAQRRFVEWRKISKIFFNILL
jgi:hypothetical protein